MTAWLTVLAIVVSGWALTRLRGSDRKRARVTGVAVLKGARTKLVYHLALWLPGLVLVVFSSWSGLVLWFGMLTVVGWVLAAMPPDQEAELQVRISFMREQAWARVARVQATLVAVFMMPARIRELEARCVQLEEELKLRDDKLRRFTSDAPETAVVQTVSVG